jgi:HupE / UreJ protein
LKFVARNLIVGGGLKEAAKIISSFTLFHLITLAITTFNLVNLPSGVVEALIAPSIIYVDVENLFRREVKTLAADLCIRVGSRLRLRFSPARN